MMVMLQQIEVVMEEFRSNARMKRRQAELLTAQAEAFEGAADQVRRAIEIDNKRRTDSASGGANASAGGLDLPRVDNGSAGNNP